VTAVRATAAGDRLLWAADTVLTWGSHLRSSAAVGDLARVREQLRSALREFQSRARAAGSGPQRVAQASAVLAALLDHVVTSMPWGAQAGWQSLAAHSATAPAGRPALQLLEVARASPSDAGLNELIAVVLALGFEARTASADTAVIDQVRAYVTQPTANPASLTGLSPRWRAAVARGPALSGWLPLWASGLAAAALLAVAYVGARVSLGAKSDGLYARIAALQVPESAPRPLPAAEPRLAAPLAAQVGAGALAVRDEIDRSVIVIPEAALFPAGEATLAPNINAVLGPIAAALQGEAGRIDVLGHTDGTLVPSARYPSEWELSVERARAVAAALRALGVAASRLTYDGRADVEPLLGAAGGFGGNGRIEIVLLAGR
jgi:type VI secretion system protein ImpK